MNFKKPKFWDYKKVSFLAFLLLPLSVIYQFFYWIAKIFKTAKKFNIPIICVGNIYLGGTGKTPLAREIYDIFKSLKKNPAFVKKSYYYLNDEIEMLNKTGAIFTSKKRTTSISNSIKDNHNLVILDDGFQDYSIKPNFSILCFNSKQLIGNGLVIPSGPLRESFSSIKRADCIFINGDKNLEFEDKIKKINQNTKIFYSRYKIKKLDKFINKKIVAFAGIGNPQNFFDLLKENNLDIEKTISFPDHHNFSENELNSILENNKDYKNDILFLTTEKDFFRINEKIKRNFEYAEIELIIEKKDEFINLITKIL